MSIYIAAFLGACLQEVLHWLDLRQRLGSEIKITRSMDYWFLTIIAIILFTSATPILVDSFNGNKLWHYLVVAFAFPSVLKVLVKVILGILNITQSTTKAKTLETMFKLENYF